MNEKNVTESPNVSGPVNRKHKDSLFRMLFNDKEALLSLYNALNETDYNNVEDLEINTLENVIYMKVKNDVSFLFDFYLNLYEHQSTLNPNLPLRDLFYVSRLLQKVTKDANLYSSTLVKIPTPRFVVFYNGTADAPAKETLRLSDSFMNQMEQPELELTVTMININSGKNPQLLDNCRQLKEYMIFVEKTRTHLEEMDITAAINRAVEECIREGILKDFLSKQRAEVIAVCLYEYDEEKHMAAERKEHYALGLAQGREEGLQEGLKRNQEIWQRSISSFIETFHDMDYSQEDTFKKLMDIFSITSEEAAQYMKQSWH